MAIGLAMIMVAAAFFMVNMDGSDATEGYYADEYWIVEGADTGTFTNASLNHEPKIYVDCTTINAGAFAGCTEITEVYLGDSVRTIGANAFKGCTGLEAIYLAGTKTIGASAFQGCTSLWTYNPSSSLSTIGENAFRGCTSLKETYLWRTSVTELKSGVYQNTGLSIIDLRNIDTIASTAFSGTSITAQVVLSEGQGAELSGVSKIYCDDMDLYRKINKSGSRVEIIMSSSWFIQVTTVDGNPVGSTTGRYIFETYSRFNIASGTDYILKGRNAEVHYPEGIGIEDEVLPKGKSSYTFPEVPAVGDLPAEGWSVRGIDGTVSSLTWAQLVAVNGVVEASPVYGDLEMTLDHSAISGRTDVSALAAAAEFTLGGTYPESAGDAYGYTLVGWEVDGTTYAPGDPVASYTAHTVRSVWEPSFTLELIYTDPKGGELGRTSCGYGETLTVYPGPGFQEGPSDRFEGWDDGTGLLPEDAQIRMTESVTLAASVSQREIFTVSYMDGETVLGTGQGYDGREFTIELEDPVSEGREFLGWTLPGGTAISNGESFTLSGNTALASEWRILERYTVTFHDGDAPISSTTVYEGTPVIATADVTPAEGKYLAGWSDADGNTVYTDRQEFTPASDTDLYAVWGDLERFTLTLMSDGQQIGEISCYEGDEVTITSVPDPVRGKEFAGWSEADGGDVAYLNGSAFVPTSSMTFHAVMRDLPEHEVRFHSGGAVVGTKTFFAGEETILDADPGRKAGHTFAGWSLSEDGEALYVGGAAVSFEGDADLYAAWDEVPCHRVSWSIPHASVTVTDQDGSRITNGGEVPEGTVLTVTVKADSGYRVTSGASQSITVDGPVTIRASVAAVPRTYQVSWDIDNAVVDVRTSAGGKVSNGQYVTEGTVLNVIVTPDRWYEVAEGAEQRITVWGPTRIVAEVLPVPTHTVTWDIEGASVEVKDQDGNPVSNGQTVPEGTVLTVTVTGGDLFEVSEGASQTIPVGGPVEISVTLEPRLFEVSWDLCNATVSVEDADGNPVSNGQEVPAGTVLTVTVAADDGYAVSEGASQTIVVDGPVSVTATIVEVKPPEAGDDPDAGDDEGGISTPGTGDDTPGDDTSGAGDDNPDDSDTTPGTGTDEPGTDTPGDDDTGQDSPMEDPDAGTDTPGAEDQDPDEPGTTPGTGTDDPGTDTPGEDTPGTDDPGAEDQNPDEPGTTPGTGTDDPGDGDSGQDAPAEDPDAGTDSPGAGDDNPDDPGTTPGTGTDEPGTDVPGDDEPGSDPDQGSDVPGDDDPSQEDPDDTPGSGDDDEDPGHGTVFPFPGTGTWRPGSGSDTTPSGGDGEAEGDGGDTDPVIPGDDDGQDDGGDGSQDHDAPSEGEGGGSASQTDGRFTLALMGGVAVLMAGVMAVILRRS